MKVCTDACVLGAYATVGKGGRLLDIGTGTGLLALMAAQRNPTAQVDAVEIDEQAAGQAVENIAASPFAHRISVTQGRIQDVVGMGVYDHILTNPPFYTNHLRSPDAATNRALHTDDLPFPELIEAVGRLLKPEGEWWVLLPPYQTTQLCQLATEAGLFPFESLSLRHNQQKPVFRQITGFSRRQIAPKQALLTIFEADPKSASGVTYTDEFRALLRDFYLLF